MDNIISVHNIMVRFHTCYFNRTFFYTTTMIWGGVNMSCVYLRLPSVTLIMDMYVVLSLDTSFSFSLE